MKVLKKQKVSKMCLICGVENDKGLKANFYEMENGQLVALFNSPSEFQSYPDRMHGGMISAILDETIGRTIWIHEPDCWGVTIDLQIKYRNPVPVNEPLMAIAAFSRKSPFESRTRMVFDRVVPAFKVTGSALTVKSLFTVMVKDVCRVSPA